MDLTNRRHNILEEIFGVRFAFRKEVDEGFAASFDNAGASISEKFAHWRSEKPKGWPRVVPFFLIHVFVRFWNLCY